MLPAEYGGGGFSNVDFVLAAEEIQAVDPGFGTTVLVNGLGLMPVWYYGSEDQKKRFIGTAATAMSLAGTAAAFPDAETAEGAVDNLKTEGYNVQINGLVQVPLKLCTATGIHPSLHESATLQESTTPRSSSTFRARRTIETSAADGCGC
jgi:hypothetical protein